MIDLDNVFFIRGALLNPVSAGVVVLFDSEGDIW